MTPENKRTFANHLGVAALREQVELRATPGVLTVQGRVKSLRPSDKYQVPIVFGSLLDEDGKTTIEFECPAHVAPTEVGEVIALTGTLKVKYSKRRDCFELQLVGGKIGGSSPEGAPVGGVVEPRFTKPKVPLGRFLADGTKKRLLFVGTERALFDAESTFRPKCDDQFCSLAMASNELYGRLAEAAAGYDAVCLVRGGGESKSFRVWNDPALIVALQAMSKPFYTALGHATDFTLADKFADESFVTPSALGAAYADALVSRRRHEDLDAALKEALSSRRALQDEFARRTKEWAIREAVNAQNRKTSLRLILVLAALFLMIVLALLLRK